MRDDSIPEARPALAAALVMALAACTSIAAPVGQRPPQPYPGGPFPGGQSGAPHFVRWPPSECVPFARQVSGINLRGNANTWWAQAEGRYPRSRRPTPGSVIVFETAGLGHVGVVTRVVSDRLILIDHANWHGRGEVAVQVPVRDTSADNSWSEVKVWWLDTNQWGAKSYRIEGFIEPR